MRGVGNSGSSGPGMEMGLNSGADDFRRDGGGDTLDRRDGQLGQNKSNLGDTLHGRDMRFGHQFSFGDEARERENAFQDKVRQALGEAVRVDDFAQERDRAKLVAVAGVEPTQQAQAQPAAAPVEDADAASADRSMRVDALGQRIEAAVDAEMRANRPGVIALRLDLGNEGAGLSSVTISISPEGLDIVLARTGAAAADDLAAAQALADRLSGRFKGKPVRVFEAAAEPAAARDGMAEISSLFRQAGGRS